jgi:hypothetical protein
MGRQAALALYVVAMAAIIVGVDFVLVFGAFYFRFLRHP